MSRKAHDGFNSFLRAAVAAELQARLSTLAKWCYIPCVCRRNRFLLLTCILAAAGGTVEAFSAGTAPTSVAHPSSGFTSSSVGAGYVLSLGTYSGVYFGTAKELVYYTLAPSGPSFYKLSELDWPLRPAVYLGTRLSLETTSGFRMRADFRSGLPTRVGYVTDTDYLNLDGTATNFSQHSSYLERLVAARLDLGWSFPLASDLSVAAFARYSIFDVKWSAQDGYYQYPPGFSPTSLPPNPLYPPYTQDTKVPIYGLVALYEQRYSIPAIVFSGEYRLMHDALSVEASFAFSPFTSVHDIDNHVLRNLIYYDTVVGCTYMEPSLSFSFRPTSQFELRFDLSYLAVLSPKDGSTVSENTTNGAMTSYVTSTAGASMQVANATLAVSFRL